ncbi:hypothetical protein GCM10011415_29390 [Salipiger pallidus]|uniref:Uncharacterized protein n=1 Tax=Salipiger pallidus TaxID=1775170 RepID=A0A8J2ZLT1_9RHOB|nr:hypothetical protein GCM10011415_29390 [Salipiger pallidus]
MNNAGTDLAFDPHLSSVKNMKRTLQLNFGGTLCVAGGILLLLTASDDDRIVHLSSALASLGLRHEPGRQCRQMLLTTYAAFRAVLNALTVSQLVALVGQRGKISAICPGFTAMEVTGFRPDRTTQRAAAYTLRVALDADVTTSTFCNDQGVLPC